MCELKEIEMPEFGESVYLKSEVDKVLAEKDSIFSQIVEQKDKLINDLIKALQSNGPRFIELDGVFINLNNITSIDSDIACLNSGKSRKLDGRKLKEIVKKLGLVNKLE